jgi:beta-phosphoglucomutase-like phosphatase (HAD superfamily)
VSALILDCDGVLADTERSAEPLKRPIKALGEGLGTTSRKG